MSAHGTLAIVPARLGSTRLPRKMLLRETGQFLFEHTVRNVERSGVAQRVVLATDSPEIVDAAAEVGIECLLTSTEHPSGTDRVREAHDALRRDGQGPFDVIVNVQGDEPELPGADLARLVRAFDDPAVEMATLCASLEDDAQASEPAVVKVVLDAGGDALYFSRAPIPAMARDDDSSPAAARKRRMRHVGVYAFRPAALEAFCSLPRGELERVESLEQLRWLEAGRKLRVVEVERAAAGIDTPDQYAAFVARHASQARHTAPASPN